MKNLAGFLNPKKKENLKFSLSRRFLDEEGKPIEWKLRQLSVKEARQARQAASSKDGMGAMLAMLAEALVQPDLHNGELLEGLSQREGRTILSAVDALEAMVDDTELGRLLMVFTKFNELDISLDEQVGQAKN